MVERINRPDPDNQPKRVDRQQDQKKTQKLGSTPALTPGELEEEFRLYQAKIFSLMPPKSGADRDAIQAMVDKLVSDAKATADNERQLGRPQSECDEMTALANWFQKNADISSPGFNQDMFNKTFSNLQNEVNNWTIDNPFPPPYPDALPPTNKAFAKGVASDKTFISAKNPEELLVEAHAIKTEIFKHKPVTSNPHLHKWIEQLSIDAFQVAEKYPGSDKMDMIMDLTGNIQDALKKHPHNDHIFKEGFDHLYNEIKNWSKGG